MTAAIEADDFTLTRSARITGIIFYDLEGPTGFQNSIAWQIYSDASDESPGTFLYGDVATAVTHDPTGVADINTEYRNTFAIAPVALPAGTYWLGLHNGPLTTASNLRVYFEKSSAASIRPSQAYDINHMYYVGWGTNSPPYANPDSELAFQLIGVPAAQITALSRSSSVPRLTFTTTAGQYYRVEYEDALVGASWNTVAGADMIAGDGNPAQVADPGAGAVVRRRFYRVILL